MRLIIGIITGLAALLFLVLYAPLRFWLSTPVRDPLDPDPEDDLDSDDPGVDVDDYREVS